MLVCVLGKREKERKRRKEKETETHRERSDRKIYLSYPGLPKLPVVLKFIKQTFCFLTLRIWLRQ